MPNQANFPQELNGSFFQRPERISLKDLALIKHSKQQILFGTTNRDNVELYVYNPDGSFAGHEIVYATDTALTLTTLIDNTGPYEVMNVDMKDLCNRLDIPPGRYAMVCNFFRDEVGSENGYKLYISQISDDRTELALTPVDVTSGSLKDLYEWVTPSVPREFAALLVEQLFSVDVNTQPNSASFEITPDKVVADMEKYNVDTIERLNYSGTRTLFDQTVNLLVRETINVTINLMAADVFNLNVQKIEIVNYINTGLIQALHTFVQQNKFDPRFLNT
jgi:hypothetical protein